MSLKIRKIVNYSENIFIDGDKNCLQSFKLFATAAVFKNPWSSYEENLKPIILDYAPQLGKVLTAEVMKWAGGGENVEAYGKAAIVGTGGEIEHASAFIHTLHFGNLYRDAVGAKSYLSFTNVRGGANNPIVIPLMHKHDAGMRSHYLTIQFNISDAPAADEIIVALGASIGGRPHHRTGDRYQDLKEMGLSE